MASIERGPVEHGITKRKTTSGGSAPRGWWEGQPSNIPSWLISQMAEEASSVFLSLDKNHGETCPRCYLKRPVATGICENCE